MRFTIGALIVFQLPALAQQNTLTLEQAVQQAVAKYPAVQVSQEQLAAAAAGINLARTAFLPRADLLGQVNRATHNNIFGLLLPQSVIPSISGPVLGTNSLSNVWGTAVGGLVSWEPFDFGLRQSNVAAAQASRKHAEASVVRTRFEVAALAADAYLTVLAAQQTLTAAQAGVERARVLEQAVGAVVRAELRPGVDASRTRAELALAQTQVFQAEQAVAIARATLAQLLGVPPSEINVQSGIFLELPPDTPDTADRMSSHPLALEQNAALDEVKARELVLNRSYFPKFNLQGSSYARGTGASIDGKTPNGGVAGLGPNIQNWAVGFTITFPLLELPSLKARKEIELHHERAEAAKYAQILQDLNGRRETAKATLEGARRIVQNTPIQLEAARAVEQQATARYKSGLGNIIEVADAQRLVTQAEIDHALAKLAVWRALLATYAAQGDLLPFLDRARGK